MLGKDINIENWANEVANGFSVVMPDGKKVFAPDIENTVYVGDSEVDYQTSVNSGLPCISVLWGFRDKELLESYGSKCFAYLPQEVVKILEDGRC